MFDFVWNLNENEFENFKEKQRTYKESNYDGDGLETFDVVYYASILLILIHSFILIYM